MDVSLLPTGDPKDPASYTFQARMKRTEASRINNIPGVYTGATGSFNENTLVELGPVCPSSGKNSLAWARIKNSQAYGIVYIANVEPVSPPPPKPALNPETQEYLQEFLPGETTAFETTRLVTGLTREKNTMISGASLGEPRAVPAGTPVLLNMRQYESSTFSTVQIVLEETPAGEPVFGILYKSSVKPLD